MNQEKLLRIVSFLVGKHFALRSRQEHHYLRHAMRSQIKSNGPDKKIIYQEDLSENNNRGLKHVKYKGKTGTIFSTSGSHCAVEIIKKYLKKISPKSKSFYCRPRENESEKNWFRNQTIGVNTLASIIPNIAKEAGWGMLPNYEAVIL